MTGRRGGLGSRQCLFFAGHSHGDWHTTSGERQRIGWLVLLTGVGLCLLLGIVWLESWVQRLLLLLILLLLVLLLGLILLLLRLVAQGLVELLHVLRLLLLLVVWLLVLLLLGVGLVAMSHVGQCRPQSPATCRSRRRLIVRQ